MPLRLAGARIFLVMTADDGSASATFLARVPRFFQAVRKASAT